MRNKPVTAALSEAEQRLPEYLQTYTGFGDDERNFRISERNWRAERNRMLGVVTARHVPSATRALLTEVTALCEAVVSNNLASRNHDQAIALGKAVETMLGALDHVKVNRVTAMARARSARTSKGGSKPKRYLVTAGTGTAQVVEGIAAVVALTGCNKNTLAARMSNGGGKAWLGRRNPETSWTVERLGTKDA